MRSARPGRPPLARALRLIRDRAAARGDCAALLAAAYRTVHLAAIRQVLAGEPPHKADAERTARLARALDAVEQAVT